MCGIVGYIGKSLSRSHVINGLERLEYRGYDSAGFACINPQNNKILYLKSSGQLSNLVNKFSTLPIDGNVGIGHTRWSTHGLATEDNAHPHFDCDKTLSIVHNGIIENHHSIRTRLIKLGHTLFSDTDTEVVAHLLEDLLAQYNTYKDALIELVHMLEGAYAIVCINQQHPNSMIAVRKGSPLCIGVGQDEYFVASDVHAFIGKVKQCVYLPDKSFVIIEEGAMKLYDFMGNELPVVLQDIKAIAYDLEKKGFEHFMLKEIYEQKSAIYASLGFLRSIHDSVWEQLGITQDFVNQIEEICIIGAGTSWHAGRIAQFYFETICGIPTSIKLASEFRYMPFLPHKNSLFIFITQSGETADTLEAMRLVNKHDLPTVALTNVPSSTAVREAGGFLVTLAGQEIAVASTKAFSTQIAVLFWLAHRIALEKKLISREAFYEAEEHLLVAAEVLENSIENYKLLIEKDLAPRYALFKRFIFLGRHISYPFALEAALKLKEISYIFAQCYPAGELKHGPIALIDEHTPIFLFSSLDSLIYKKLLSNAQEVKARNGHLVIFAFEGQDELINLADQVFIIPEVHPLLAPLAMTGLMQFFVYQIAHVLECPIDKPRNLAKSVTVE